MSVSTLKGASVGRLFIELEPLCGLENMRRDSLLLDQYVVNPTTPILRLYSWKTPCVTLGRFQKDSSVDSVYAQMHGIDIVRRPTGGKGVFHNNEVTYSFIGSLKDGIPPGVEDSYAYLAGALVLAFQNLGLNPSLGNQNPHTVHPGACYMASTAADLCLGAAKLSGSAQVWKSDAVLQHGSFVISRDVQVESALFKLHPQEVSTYKEKTTSLAELMGNTPAKSVVQGAIVKGFSQHLNMDFFESTENFR